jgi:hypothetical protein
MATSDKIYRYHSGTWDEWVQDDIAPGLYINEISFDDDNSGVWFRSNNALIRYDGNFTVFDGGNYETVQDVHSIIPFEGSGIYFSYDPWLKYGILSYKNDTWEYGYIEKDMDLFLGEPTCLSTDEKGNLWVGTAYGISCFTGSDWQNYITISSGEAIGYVYGIQAIPGNKVYAHSDIGILEIEGATVSVIPAAPYSIGQYISFGVDNLSRIWVSYYTYEPDILAYYDGNWHEYDYSSYDTIIPDRTGGIWLPKYSGMLHIKNDLSQEEYSYPDPGMSSYEILSLYCDSNNVLWMVQADVNNNKLWSLEGTWTGYSSNQSYPDGVAAVTEDNAGDLLVLCRTSASGGGEGGGEEPLGEGEDENQSDAFIYLFKNNTFSLYKDGFYIPPGYDLESGWNFMFINVNGTVYCIGDLEKDFIENLLKISGESGSAEQKVWSFTYAVNLGSGTVDTINLEPGISLDAGLYSLKTHLLSSAEQVLADSFYPFVVRGTNVSLTLKGEPEYGNYVKRETDLSVTVESFNNTPDNKDNLSLVVKKISPGGTETEIFNQTISLSSGQSNTDTIVFNESEIGTWKIYSEINEGTTTLSTMELVLEVTEPAVSIEIVSPQYAGDEPFDMSVKLLNDGNINAVVNGQWSVVSNGDVKLDETIPLNPGEASVLAFNDTITTDRSYIFTLSGDVEKSETIAVQYGYVENFNINILPAYREGRVMIGYDLSNSGGLPFSDEVHFELLTMGGTEPLAAIDKTYTLSPGEAPYTDTLDFDLAPGNYRLKYRTSKTAETETMFTVQPAGSGTLVVSSSEKYTPGQVEISYTLTNSDTVTGNISIDIQLTGPGSAPLISETRNYYLEPQGIIEDILPIDFEEKGIYTLTITGDKVETPVTRVFRVLNLEETTATLHIGEPETDRIPVTVTMDNTGYDDFTGSVLMTANEIISEKGITVASETQFSSTFYLETGALSPGTHEIEASLYHSSGERLYEATKQVVISDPDIIVSQVPQNLEIDAGNHATVTLTVKNEGHVRGEAILEMSVFDTFRDNREIALNPGEEIEIKDIYIDAPADLPTGNYPFNYTLTGTGVENGVKAGNFNFKVNGVSLEVDASLDHSLYNEGETAQLTIDISSETAVNAPLEAVVNWGNFSERRPFTLATGSTSLVFNIPLDEKRDEKVFYGIYHEGGKGIHLNDIYLHFQDTISVETDRQVYAPGEVVHAVFTGEQSGTLTAEAFGESHTLTISSSASADFQVP